MASSRTLYSVRREGSGWLVASSAERESHRFATRDEALAWCRAQEKSSPAAAPEEGAYDDAIEVERYDEE
jgi:hypothetical protein